MIEQRVQLWRVRLDVISSAVSSRDLFISVLEMILIIWRKQYHRVAKIRIKNAE